MDEPLNSTLGYTESRDVMWEVYSAILEAAANAMPEVCKPYVCSEAEIDMLVAEEMEADGKADIVSG